MSSHIEYQGELLPMCENTFERLAKEAPEVLMEAMGAVMEHHHLTFAAEHLGKNTSSDLAVAFLCGLLSHKSVPVREGVLYGLAEHVRNPLVSRFVQKVADRDEHEGIRELARELLEEGWP